MSFNQHVIDEFRANEGRVGGPFQDARLLLLTTVGARTGQRHTTPVGYLQNGDGRLLIIASAAGSPRHPDWYINLLANPHVTCETGPFVFEASAERLAGPERDEAFERACEHDPGWADYQASTTRVIPVVALTPLSGGPATDSWSESLVLVHNAFRRELALIRKEFTEAGPRLGAQLRINCLALCQGLHGHHIMEDNGIYPLIDANRPELADAMTRLRAEHSALAKLLEELQAFISRANADPVAARAEVDRLSAAVEAHLDYEEQQLLPVLSAGIHLHRST
ncbi:nitroreductase/quinone reductase family protein [Hoyosella altamirensis]|uniref:Deazaflavin-dependent oxidoreductase (Nitroreductase family) n=1 Tax=Hoyosella altamirensis TaxID=616997 RepID=A0A839RIZ4_9ACTN|nr:nitroreductase/quinone reductase family protein [Hoyosella altamirensis]MBB3036367.1 deazaflavin-dependent oxidoreductase (nitroreductase family) [Hoyosella altamirensis]